MAVTFPTDTRELRRVASLVLDMYVRKIHDQVFESNAVWDALLRREGVMTPWSGGARIGVPVRLEVPTNVGSYRGFDVLDNSPTDVKTVALHDSSEYFAAVTVSMRDLDLISGDGAVVNLLQEETEQAMAALVDLLNKHMWLDGTGNQSKDLVGFETGIPTDPTTGTYGGISRVSNTAWRNVAVDNGGIAADVIEDLRTAMTNATGGPSKSSPDVIFTNRGGRDLFEALLVATLETDPIVLARSDRGDASIPNLQYRKAEIIVDENATIYGGGNSMYVGINTRHTKMYVHRNRNMKMGEIKEADRQTVLSGFVTWHGQYIITEPRRHFVVFNGA